MTSTGTKYQVRYVLAAELRSAVLEACWKVLPGTMSNLGSNHVFAFGSTFSTGSWQRAKRMGTAVARAVSWLTNSCQLLGSY